MQKFFSESAFAAKNLWNVISFTSEAKDLLTKFNLSKGCFLYCTIQRDHSLPVNTAQWAFNKLTDEATLQPQ